MSEILSLLESLGNENLSLEGANQIFEELDELPIKSQGITKIELTRFIHIVADPYSPLRSAHRFKILKSYLYPRDLIPSEVVITICGGLGVKTANNTDKRSSNPLQVHLLTWLISVYSFFEEPDIIERLYGILFNYLEFEFLRPKIAHLLFLATKRKHVNHSRIERLRGLYAKYDDSEHLAALLILYKEHVPEEIFDTFPRISHTIFAHPDYTYLNELVSLRNHSQKRVLQSTNDELNYLEVFSQKLKKRKRNLATADFSISMTLSQNESIHSISALSRKIETLNIPSDPSVILGDNSGFPIYTLALKGQKKNFEKLELWINFVLEEFDVLPLSEKLDLLESLKRYSSITSEIPGTVATEFLSNEKILKNSTPEIQSYIWYFLKHLNPLSDGNFEPLLNTFLAKIETQSAEWVISFLNALTYLFKSWPNKLRFFREEKDEELSEEELYRTILKSHLKIRLLLPDILINSKYNRMVLLKSLQFITVLQNFPIKQLAIEDVVLSPPLVYIYYFVSDPLVISKLCGHLNFSKLVLQEAISNEDTIKLTALHNSYVVDICNSIWRNKAFDVSKKSDGTSFGLTYEFINSWMTKVPIFDRNSSFPSLFNISHSPAFSSRTANIVRSLEDADTDCSNRHAGPLTPASVKELLHDKEENWLKTDYESTKIDILRTLDNAGYTGLADLLFSHLKSLLNKR